MIQGHKQCYAFGNGIYGQLATGQSRNSYLPAKIKLDKVEDFAAGENHSLFIIDGNVYACGDNSSGQLGVLFNKKFSSEPIKYINIDSEFKSSETITILLWFKPKNTQLL